MQLRCKSDDRQYASTPELQAIRLLGLESLSTSRPQSSLLA